MTDQPQVWIEKRPGKRAKVRYYVHICERTFDDGQDLTNSTPRDYFNAVSGTISAASHEVCELAKRLEPAAA